MTNLLITKFVAEKNLVALLANADGCRLVGDDDDAELFQAAALNLVINRPADLAS